MTNAGDYPRFPATSLASQADFIEFRRATQDRLDARYLHETALLTRDDMLSQAGTCAICQRRAVFTSRTTGWDRQPDGSPVPDWGEALVCDCEDRLGNRARAVVHAAQAVCGLRGWTRLLLFGPERAAHRRLAALAAATARVPALPAGEAAGSWRLAEVDGAHDLVVAIDCLHHVPPLDDALTEFRRVLAPGGSLLFTVPFQYEAARTVSRDDLPRVGGRLPATARAPVHAIGWDILARLRDAGFADAVARCYWSAELGYLGAFNMIFHATH
jgi:SAM-dependent methyltransferase